MLKRSLFFRISGVLLVVLSLYLVILLVFNDKYDEPKAGLISHSICYFDFLNLNDKLNGDDVLKKECDIYIIKSKTQILDLKSQNFYFYSQKSNFYLTILSKFKLGKNLVNFNNSMFNPVYTGFVRFPNRRILLSFLSTEDLNNIDVKNKNFIKYLTIRRNFNEFRNKKIPILFLANWDLTFFSLQRWLHYLQIIPVNYRYNLKRSLDWVQVFKSSDFVKIHNIIKDDLVIKVVINVM